MVRYAVVGVDSFSCSLLKVIERSSKDPVNSPLMKFVGSLDLEFSGCFGDLFTICGLGGLAIKSVSNLNFEELDVVVFSHLIPNGELHNLISSAFEHSVNVIVLGEEPNFTDTFLKQAEELGLIFIFGVPFSYIDGVVLGSIAREYVDLLGFKWILDVIDFVPSSFSRRPNSMRVINSVTYTILPKESMGGFSGESVLSFKLDDERISMLFSASSSLELLGFKLMDTVISAWAFSRAGFRGFPDILCRFYSRNCVLENGGYLEAVRGVFDLVKKVINNE